MASATDRPRPEGHDRELGAIERAIGACAERSSVLVVTAPPGAGKSHLFERAIRLAAGSGARVLRSAPTAAEVSLPYAALGDLLAPVDDLSSLPELLRDGLEAALLRAAPPHDGVDTRRVGRACVELFGVLAARTPLVVAIDDLHWLDDASAAALAFAARRLPERGVLVLATRRRDEPGPDLAGERLDLGPLEDGVVRRIVRATEGAPRLTVRTTAEIVRAAAGNPFVAIELAHAAAVAGPAARGRAAAADPPLIVPDDLVALASRRFTEVDAAVLDALAAGALLARAEVAVLGRLGMIPALEQAERHGLVSAESGRVVFTHPLFAAAALARTPALVRRRLHGSLAGVVTDPVESIRHEALACDGPEADLAGRLGTVAAELAARGATSHAAELAVLAADLSPDDDPARDLRHVEAALLSFRRGDPDTASRMLSGLDPARLPREVRVRELVARTYISFASGHGDDARHHAEEALTLAGGDAERIELHSLLARATWDDFRLAAHHADRAVALIDSSPDPVPPSMRSAALLAQAEGRFFTGLGLDHDLFRLAIELERDDPPFATDSAEAAYAVLLKQTDELDRARTMLHALLERVADDGAMPFALSHLPQLELWAGNWDRAEDHARRHLDAATATGQSDQVAQARANIALIDLMLGDVAAARELSEHNLAVAVAHDDLWAERSATALLGQCALADGDAAAAAALLDRSEALSQQMGVLDPGYCRLQPDHVEALVACGRLDDADGLVASMERTAARLGRSTSIAAASRSRALVAAARGDRVTAVAAARDAVERYGASALVVDHARALLTLGQVHRRFKEKAAARDALQRALEEFERLGAARFAARARQDLARLGLRPPSGLGLTETERRVAEAAGTGRTVRQVADELFISPKTVEANLTRVYRKLGISGRAELATWLATRP